MDISFGVVVVVVADDDDDAASAATAIVVVLFSRLMTVRHRVAVFAKSRHKPWPERSMATRKRARGTNEQGQQSPHKARSIKYFALGERRAEALDVDPMLSHHGEYASDLETHEKALGRERSSKV